MIFFSFSCYSVVIQWSFGCHLVVIWLSFGGHLVVIRWLVGGAQRTVSGASFFVLLLNNVTGARRNLQFRRSS